MSMSILNTYKSFIFDFDYTLFDTSKGVIHCMMEAFKSQGINGISEQEIEAGIGLSLKEFFGKYATDQQISAAMETRFLEESSKVMVEMTVAFPSTISVITELNKRGYILGISTGKYRDRVYKTLAKYKLSDMFAHVLCGDEVTNKKPHPESLLKWLEVMRNVSKQDVVYVGDHYYDVMAAEQAGIDSIAVTTGKTKKEEFLKYNPSFLINDLKELLET